MNHQPTTMHGAAVEETRALWAAIEHSCTCKQPQSAIHCAAHEAVFFDQRFVDGLRFARAMRARLIAEEWRA